MKPNQFFYLIKEGIRSIFIHGFMSFASVTIIVACLIIMGSFSLLAVNIDSIIKDFEEDNQILAFVDDEGYSDDEAGAAAYLADAESLQVKLESLSNVREAVFVSREEAWQNFVSEYDDESMFSDVDESVLRHRYVIYLKDLTLMSDTVAEIEQVRGIASVNAHTEISDGFIAVRNIVSVVTMILIVILMIVSVFIVNNTVKLATYSRKEELAIMKMVGASNSFIRFPFVVEGLILGILGGAIAFALQWLIYDFICEKIMTSLAANLISLVPFTDMMLPVLVIYLGVGLLVGMFGSNIAIRNYLKV